MTIYPYLVENLFLYKKIFLLLKNLFVLLFLNRRVKGLGEEDDPALDSAAAWVSKSRTAEKEKELAKKTVRYTFITGWSVVLGSPG